jgi:LysR family transcriptional regulator, low CO2-responsive transcriptional regulator
MDITLRQLRYFREVAETGSFTRAAELLYVSQPTISAAIKDLERDVKLPLFEQVGRRTQLTEAGRILRRHCDRVLAEVEEAEQALAGLWGGEAGRLVLGASSTPGTYLLPEVLGKFRQGHPRVEVALEIVDTHEVLARVQDGRLDLGVVGEVAFDPSLQATLLQDERLVLILPRKHPLAEKETLEPADLEHEPFVLREEGSSTREVLERALGEQGLRPRVVMELGNTEAIKKAVAAGLGLSFVSEHAVELERQAGVLVAREVPALSLCRGIYVVARISFRMTPLHERFLGALHGLAR